jgi:dTDP-glucose 4,6-dehydratase
MRIIVTGGAGFIGSSFINYLKKTTTVDILCIDKLTYASNPNNLKHSVKFLKKDICDITPEDLGEYDYLVNFAAESHVDNSIKNGRPFVRTNVEGTFNLLECARQNHKLKKFIQISTDEVYGDMDDYKKENFLNKSADETHSLNPSSYYSATKAAADLLVKSAHRTFGLPYLITRTCNNFGEHQNPEKFLPKIYQCIKENKEIPVYGDGNQSREWIWVEDKVKILWELIQSEEAINEVYNIGSGIEYKNLELINLINSCLPENKAQTKFVPDRLGHDRAYRLRCTSLEKLWKTPKLGSIPYKFKHIKDYFKDLYQSN